MSKCAPLKAFICLTAVALLASACSTLDRLSEVGSAPTLSQIQNPAVIHGNQPLVLPMPQPQPAIATSEQTNSLWRAGSRAFFKDQRAGEVGDILTVVIEIDDRASLNNSSQRQRDNSENASLTAMLGFEQELGKLLPDAYSNDPMVGASSDSNSLGSGSISRDESINVRVAAMVTQVLPNGNLVVAGRQETRVNFELRDLQVAGIVRPEDITSANEISFDQIAEARIAYGGRGHLSDVQQPRYGQQIYDILWPF